MKIAFLFLTYGKLSKSEIWYNYFKNADENKYSIYIHNKYDFNSDNKIHDLYFEKFIIRNKIPTDWGNISLVRATIKLLNKAIIDKNNKFFYLVSDTTVPLKSFDDFYIYVFEKNANIFKDVVQRCYYLDDERNKRYMTLSKKLLCSIENFAYCSQWMILDRKTAKYFAKYDKTSFFENMAAPDEHYFITICNIKKIRYLCNNNFLFTKWSENSFHPNSYLNVEEVDKEELEGFYFMRKIIHS